MLSGIVAIALLATQGKGVNLLVTQDNVRVGGAFASSVIQPDGRLVETMNAHIGKASVFEKSVFDKNGRPVSRDYRTEDPSTGTNLLSVSYGKSSITMEAVSGGKRLPPRRIPIPRAKRLECGAVFWFKRVTPKAKASASWDEFDLHSLKWTKETARYLGDRDFNGDYGKVRVHEVIGLFGVRYLDSEGDLVYEQIVAAGHTFRYVKELKPVTV